MIYVSLPVHTQPLVVAGQVRNFTRFLPQATVLLHVSRNARFEMGQLTRALLDRGCGNVLINPTRIATDWGNILDAHLTNVAYLRSRGDADRICLHASNDMLVRPGLAAHLRGGHNFCHRRLVRPGTRWRFGAAALADPCLTRLRRRFGHLEVIASQIEGSCYEAEVLYAIADLIRTQPLLPAPLAYPREEVWFSTLAHALQARIDGTPYIFSELHRFDRVYWQLMQHVDPVIGHGTAMSDFLRRAIEYALIKTNFHRISKRWVDAVARDDVSRLAPYQTLSDGNSIWRIYEQHGLYGVKRVPRRAASPLRQYIDGLAEQAVL